MVPLASLNLRGKAQIADFAHDLVLHRHLTPHIREAEIAKAAAREALSRHQVEVHGETSIFCSSAEVLRGGLTERELASAIDQARAEYLKMVAKQIPGLRECGGGAGRFPKKDGPP